MDIFEWVIGVKVWTDRIMLFGSYLNFEVNYIFACAIF